MASGCFAFNPVSIGQGFSFFLSDNGVWCCGKGIFGSLGLGPSLTNTHKQITKVEFTQRKINFVSCGQAHTCFLDSEGTVWVCGWNDYGQLGFDLLTPRFYPTEVEHIPKIKALHTSYNHTILLDFEGGVWTCGWNTCGQLGTGRAQGSRPSFERVSDLPQILSINAGKFCSLFVGVEGSVWVAGNGNFFMNASKTDASRVEEVTGLPPIKFVSCRRRHVLFLDYTGSVWASGSNLDGQLGVGSLLPPNKSTETSERIKVPGSEIFTAVSTGDSHSLFLSNCGQVFVCGSNINGQLGLEGEKTVFELKPLPNLPHITIICAGQEQSILVDVDGVVWACGSTTSGNELANACSSVPTKIELPPIIHKQTVVPTKSARRI